MPGLGDPHWFNPPPRAVEEAGRLLVETGRQTDFWNNTFYGFRRLSAHLRATPVTGDFSLVVTFAAAYATLYDQAGAMLRVDDNNWLKCGVEFTDGRRNFSVVVTRDDQSDWSVMPIEGAVEAPVTLRLTRHAEALRVELEQDGTVRLVRLAYLRMPATVEAGPMCCSPVGEGLRVTFSRIAFGEPIARELHAQDDAAP
jgi:regulation of enolase protein 1 (concanavalin A-like superfamily)